MLINNNELVEKISNGEFESDALIFKQQGNCDMCGSQRCDQTALWMSGCTKFKEYLLHKQELKKDDDSCLNCEIFRLKQEQVLSTCDSIFDAAYDLDAFTKECKATCSKN